MLGLGSPDRRDCQRDTAVSLPTSFSDVLSHRSQVSGRRSCFWLLWLAACFGNIMGGRALYPTLRLVSSFQVLRKP